MATTLTIPAATVAAGTHPYGPVTPAVGATHVVITIDVSSYPSNQEIQVALQESYDGGTTWPDTIASVKRPGGFLSNDGVQDGNARIDTNILGDPASAQRRIRATVINGVSLTTSGGSLVVS